MTKISGANVLVQVKKASGQFVTVGGQTNSTLNREADTMDVTDKTTGGFKSSMAGLLSWSVDCDGFITIDDSAGYDLLEEAFLAREPVMVSIRLGAKDSVTGATYSGLGYLVDLPLEFAMDDAVTYSFSIEGAGEMTKVKGAAAK